MAIKKKIDFSEKLRSSVIEKGAMVTSDATNSDQWKVISLRLPTAFLEEADAIVKKRVGLNRNAWILEAMQEKISKGSY